MSTPDDSIFSLFLNQPLVLWSFVLGVLVLVTAVTLYIISTLRRKKQSASQTELLVNTVTVEAAHAPAQGNQSGSISETALIVEADESTPHTAVNPLAAIADEMDEEEAETGTPEFVGVEVNSKLADLFQNDIIVDPHIQALRDSLDDVPLADLLAQLHDVADQLKEHLPQPALEVEN